MKHETLTPGALTVALFLAAIWGGNPVAIKIGLADCPPLRLGWMRFVLGGVVVAAVALARRQSLKVERHEAKALLSLGAIFSAQLAFLNLGQDRTSAAHAAVLMSSYPLWTAVFAHFFVPGDRLTVTRTLGGLVAYTGVVVVSVGGLIESGGDTVLGDGLLVVSAVLLGARQIVLSRGAQAIAIEKLLLAQALVGTASFVPASLVFEPEPTRWTVSLALALVYQGVVIAGFAFLTQTWLLKHFPPSRVTNVYLAQPVFGVLLSYWILGERIGPELGVGAALVIAGSYLVQRQSR